MLLSWCNEYRCHRVSSAVWVRVSGVGVKSIFPINTYCWNGTFQNASWWTIVLALEETAFLLYPFDLVIICLKIIIPPASHDPRIEIELSSFYGGCSARDTSSKQHREPTTADVFHTDQKRGSARAKRARRCMMRLESWHASDAVVVSPHVAVLETRAARGCAALTQGVVIGLHRSCCINSITHVCTFYNLQSTQLCFFFSSQHDVRH